MPFGDKWAGACCAWRKRFLNTRNSVAVTFLCAVLCALLAQPSYANASLSRGDKILEVNLNRREIYLIPEHPRSHGANHGDGSGPYHIRVANRYSVRNDLEEAEVVVVTALFEGICKITKSRSQHTAFWDMNQTKKRPKPASASVSFISYLVWLYVQSHNSTQEDNRHPRP